MHKHLTVITLKGLSTNIHMAALLEICHIVCKFLILQKLISDEVSSYCAKNCNYKLGIVNYTP